VRGTRSGRPHFLIEDGAWVPTHAISNKEVVRGRPPLGRCYPTPHRARRRRHHPTEEERAARCARGHLRRGVWLLTCTTAMSDGASLAKTGGRGGNSRRVEGARVQLPYR